MTAMRWIGLLMLTLGLPLAAAGELDLGTDLIQSLPDEARERYEQAVSDYDHAYEEGGLRNLLEAASLAPDAVELQFLAGRMAGERADRTRGPEALEALEASRAAYQRVLENPEASETDLARAQRGLEDLTVMMQELSERERRLREAGDSFLVQFSAFQARLEASRAMRSNRPRPSLNRGTGANPLLPTGDESRRSTSPDQGPDDGSGLLPDADYSRRHNAPVTN